MGTAFFEPILPATRRPLEFRGEGKLAFVAFCVFCSYLVAAEAAFFLGTLSDKIFAPFWPPNIVLLVALLLNNGWRRWLCVAAALPAHVIAEWGVHMPLHAIVVAFATNVMVALGGVIAIRRLLGPPPWFNEFGRAATYVIFAALLPSAIVALAGAFVPILAGGELGRYWSFWLQWFASNAIGSLTIGPIALILFTEELRVFRLAGPIRRLELVVGLFTVVLVSEVSLTAWLEHYNPAFLPAILYAPMVTILWIAARFGACGASLAVVATAAVLVSRALGQPAIFANSDPETNVLAIQIFLGSLAAPALLLGASIDQIKSTEQRKRRDEERLAFVAQAANVGLWSYDPSADTFWTTDFCRELLDAAATAEMTRAAFLACVHPDDVQLAAALLCADTPKLSPSEFRIQTADERNRWLIGRASPGSDEDGNPIINGVVSDITARKDAENESDLQRLELAHLMRVYQVGELSGGLAHELTQPLTAILANAQAARMMLSGQRVATNKLREVVDDIIADDHRAGEVVKRLRGLLKNGKFDSEAVDINDLVISTIDLLRNELISRGVRTATELCDGPLTVQGDPIQLQQVFLNLVMNAIDSVYQMSTLRRHVTIKTRPLDSDEIEVVVMDLGIGISSAVEARIFEPFFTTKERGLGLGLSICSMIINRHQGVLTLRNNPDGGAIACVRLPSLRNQ